MCQPASEEGCRPVFDRSSRPRGRASWARAAEPENHYRGPALRALSALRAGAAGRRTFRGVFSYRAGGARVGAAPPGVKLPAQAELLDDGAVPVDVLALQVV